MGKLNKTRKRWDDEKEKKRFCCARTRTWFLSGDRFISGPKDDRAPFACRFLPPITIVYFRPKTDLALYRGRHKRKELVLILEQENPDDPPSKCSLFFSDLPLSLFASSRSSRTVFDRFPNLHARWLPKQAFRQAEDTGNPRCEKPFANGAGKYRRLNEMPLPKMSDRRCRGREDGANKAKSWHNASQIR